MKKILISSILLVCLLKPDEKIKKLIEAEHAFAKVAATKSMKDAFENYLDSTGIILNGNRFVNGLEAYKKVPADTTQLLLWYPTFVQRNDAGDFGFSTGPYHYYADKKAKPVASGFFFSIWKKNAKGDFKVLFDGGVNHSKPHGEVLGQQQKKADQALLDALSYHGTAPVKTAVTTALTDFEKEIATKDGVYKWASKSCVFLRPNEEMYNSPQSFSAKHEQYNQHNFSFSEKGNGFSMAKDMYYQYGNLKLKQTDGTEKTSGYYMRVWQYQQQGWAMVADVQQFKL